MTDDTTPAKVRLTDGLGRCDAAHVRDCQEAEQQCERRHDWVTYNPRTNTYDTLDGTSVAAELVDSVQCLADVLHIAQIRARQRSARAA